MGAANDHLSNDVVIAVYESLFRYWKTRGFRPAEASDLAQEGLCKALESAKQWQKKAKIETFLISVGKNRGIDYLRKEGTYARLKDAMRLKYSKSQRRTPKAKIQ